MAKIILLSFSLKHRSTFSLFHVVISKLLYIVYSSLKRDAIRLQLRDYWSVNPLVRLPKLLVTVLILGVSLSSAWGQTVSGTVFRDFNASGQRDNNATYNEIGVAGVTVRAFLASGTQVGTTAVTSASGTYAITTGTSAPVRIEFSNYPITLFSGPHGAQSGTSVQFVTGTATANLGLNGLSDYCQPNPEVALACYIFGPYSVSGTFGPLSLTANDVTVSFPYDAGGPPITDQDNAPDPPAPAYLSPAPSHIATKQEVGAVWGTAYNPDTKDLFMSAFNKRHVGFGPSGPGAIYRRNAAGVVSLFANLNAGTDPHPTSVTFEAWFTDAGSFDQIGKVGFGDMDLSEDKKSLYVINLFDRTLNRLDVATGAVISSAAVPLNLPLSAPSTRTTAVAADVRPFAIGLYNGRVFVGLVNTAESTQTPMDLWAYVCEYFPATNTFATTPVMNWPLNDGADPDYLRWLPWLRSTDPGAQPKTIPNGDYRIRTDVNTLFNNGAEGVGGAYPQPWFTDISFDAGGNMNIGMRDRAGDQIGNYAGSLNPNDGFTYFGFGYGQLWRAAPSTTTAGNYDIEVNGVSGGVDPSNGRGVGGIDALYFLGPALADPNTGVPITSSHQGYRSSMGGLLQLPGRRDFMETMADPLRNYSGGVARGDNLTALQTKVYELYAGTDPITFGKANGLGEPESQCNPAPIEVGNRFWIDTDRDGLQDADETSVAGLAGITLNLYQGSTLVGTTTVDATGTYYFNATNVTSTSGLLANTAYEIRFTPPAGYAATVTNAGSNTAVDSDASATGVISLTTGSYGMNNHTYDVGIYNTPCSLTLTAVTPGLCNSATNQYTVSGTISLTAAVAGTATITDGTSTTTVSVSAGQSSITFSLPGMVSNASSHTITVSLPSCGSATAIYNAPASCSAGSCPSGGSDIVTTGSTAKLPPAPPGSEWRPNGGNTATIDNQGNISGLTANGTYSFLLVTSGSTCGSKNTLTEKVYSDFRSAALGGQFATVPCGNDSCVPFSFGTLADAAPTADPGLYGPNSPNTLIFNIDNRTIHYVEASDTYVSGTSYQLAVNYNPISDLLTYKINGQTLSFHPKAVNPNWPTGSFMSATMLYLASSTAGQRVDVTNIKLNGSPLTNNSLTIENGAQALVVSGYDYYNGFNVTADVTFTFATQPTNGGALFFDYKFGQTTGCNGNDNGCIDEVVVTKVTPPCGLTLTANPTTCVANTNQYMVNGVVSLTSTVDGILTISAGNATTTVAVSTSTTTVNYSLNGLTSDGSTLTVTASLPGCGSAVATYTAPASCSVAPVCSVVAVTATPTPCLPATNRYTVSGTVSLTNTIAGTLTISVGVSTTTVAVTAGTSSVNYTFVDMPSDGSTMTVKASLPTCGSATTTYTAPASCSVAPPCSVSAVATPGLCSTTTNTYSPVVAITVYNPTTGQTLTVTDGATTQTFSTSAGSQNTFTATYIGLISDGTVHSVSVNLPGCGSTTTTYTAPASCSVAPPACSLVTPTVTAGVCSSATNTFSSTVVVTVNNPSSGGILTITDGTSSQPFTTTAGSTNTFTMVFNGLASNGAGRSVTASLTGCGSASATYTAPASCSLTPVVPRLELQKMVDKSVALQGDTLTYKVVLTNTGPIVATNVLVRDSTNGLTYLPGSISAPVGTTYSQAIPVSLWSVSSISAGQSLTLTYKAIVDSTGVIYNTATIPGIELPEDSVKVCTSVPIKMCVGDVYTLTVPAGRASYNWYRNGVLIIDQTTNVLTVTLPGSYSLSLNTAGGQCPDFSCCPAIFEVDSIPVFQAAAITATCLGNAPQANGRLVISGFNPAFRYQYSAGATFNAAASLSGPAQTIPVGGVLATNLASPATSMMYTVRVYNGSGCYTDQTVVLLPTVCGCPAEVCVPYVVSQTKRARRVGDR